MCRYPNLKALWTHQFSSSSNDLQLIISMHFFMLPCISPGQLVPCTVRGIRT